MRRLSAVVITHNEERDVGRTLDALSFADELLVVDSLSTDRTVEVCTGRGARVVSHPFRGYGPQKRHAVGLAAHDWVLCVDADEVVTPELAAAIGALLSADSEPRCAAYRVAFRTVFMGHPLVHGARETHVRLFDRRRAGWDEAPVHESVVVQGEVGTLAGLVLHETARDVSEALHKLDHYTTRAADERRGRQVRGPAALFLSGAYHFFRHYVLRRQFLNGVPGFTWSMLFAVGSVVKHVKGHELAPERGAGSPD
ncbi:MAG TPA: glycosyltransferase family 2 protein, partial [Anaeromyxobacter sp.]